MGSSKMTSALPALRFRVELLPKLTPLADPLAVLPLKLTLLVLAIKVAVALLFKRIAPPLPEVAVLLVNVTPSRALKELLSATFTAPPLTLAVLLLKLLLPTSVV